MKKVAILWLCLFALFATTSCSSTRKVVNESATIETQVTEQREQEKQASSQRESEATTSTQIRDLSNVVIEFTKVEYADGSVEVTEADTSSQQAEAVLPRDRESESKPPNTGAANTSTGKVKAITTGRITINADKTQTTEAKETTAEKKDTMDYQRSIFKGQQKEVTKTKTREIKLTPSVKAAIFLFVFFAVIVFVILKWKLWLKK